jgi:hypothetical protein
MRYTGTLAPQHSLGTNGLLKTSVVTTLLKEKRSYTDMNRAVVCSGNCKIMRNDVICLSFEWSLTADFATKTSVTFFISLVHATCPAHLTLLYLIIPIVFGEEYKLWGLSSLHSP